MLIKLGKILSNTTLIQQIFFCILLILNIQVIFT